jgi:serine/threonine protein kinase
LGSQNSSNTTKTDVGPILWMAPEALNDQAYSEKTDVWAFGVTCYEIINNKPPFSGIPPLQVSLKVISQGLHAELPTTPKYALVSKGKFFFRALRVIGN